MANIQNQMNINSINSSVDEVNNLSSIELCIQAQELVQELLQKFPEVNTLIKTTVQAIHQHDQATYITRKQKIEEHFVTIESLFSKLRLYCRVINQRKIDCFQNTIINNDMQSMQQFDQLSQNKHYLTEKLVEKNSYLKIAIDNLSNLVWQINAMQSSELKLE